MAQTAYLWYCTSVVPFGRDFWSVWPNPFTLWCLLSRVGLLCFTLTVSLVIRTWVSSTHQTQSRRNSSHHPISLASSWHIQDITQVINSLGHGWCLSVRHLPAAPLSWSLIWPLVVTFVSKLTIAGSQLPRADCNSHSVECSLYSLSSRSTLVNLHWWYQIAVDKSSYFGTSLRTYTRLDSFRDSRSSSDHRLILFSSQIFTSSHAS